MAMTSYMHTQYNNNNNNTGPMGNEGVGIEVQGKARWVGHKAERGEAMNEAATPPPTMAGTTRINNNNNNMHGMYHDTYRQQQQHAWHIPQHVQRERLHA
ncbi:hypothetical protein CVT25_014042 [Psilocybe cyanescens]|uniref:Uncharacterized protein n=1 Tax=Psilocybe cyanescens TaxID=93625 RepID=A0A409XZA2_PSICY|nr:hypothetical protein CVT25_014042 [Psilocybe cyanescens]